MAGICISVHIGRCKYWAAYSLQFLHSIAWKCLGRQKGIARPFFCVIIFQFFHLQMTKTMKDCSTVNYSIRPATCAHDTGISFNLPTCKPTKCFEVCICLGFPSKPKEAVIHIKTYPARSKYEAITTAIVGLLALYRHYYIRSATAYLIPKTHSY